MKLLPPWLVKPPIGEDPAAPDAAMDDDADAMPLPPLTGKREVVRPDPRPTGKRPAGELDPRPTGKKPAAELDPRPATLILTSYFDLDLPPRRHSQRRHRHHAYTHGGGGGFGAQNPSPPRPQLLLRACRTGSSCSSTRHTTRLWTDESSLDHEPRSSSREATRRACLLKQRVLFAK